MDQTSASFLKSKFDNICLILLIVFLVCLLTWTDKHGNGDYVKWLEVFTAGIGGAYLGLITASRQAWETKTKTSDTNGNGVLPASPTPATGTTVTTTAGETVK
jgi:hypothetical protein